MLHQPRPPLDVYTDREIARAAGVPVRVVARLVQSGQVRTIDGTFAATSDAVTTVRRLRSRGATGSTSRSRPCLSPPTPVRRATGVPLAASAMLHVASFALILWTSTLGVWKLHAVDETQARVPPMRLVFLSLPGPGGGGGGGGAQQPMLPAKAARRGPATTTSPVPIRRAEPPPARPAEVVPPRPTPAPSRLEPREDPPLLAHEPLPPVFAPVVSLAGDRTDRLGVVGPVTGTAESQGPGAADGTGTGAGAGLGEGTGSGIGPGRGGGTGGGPYRPGSGIEPPRLVREVKPRYTETARTRGVEGEVVLEVVVTRDGRVSDARVVRTLGAGLDEQAVEAVRLWQFEPARRLGVPVDVLVEIAVEFRLR
jgi:protein TonB